MNPLFQNNCGGFNNCFPGPAINFSNFDAFASFLGNRGLNSPEEFYNFSMPEFVKYFSLGDSADKDSNFIYSSILLHETRHFHDCMLSPYADHLKSLKLNSILDAARVLGLLCASCTPDKTNILITPILPWASLNEEERRKKLQRYEPFIKKKIGNKEFDIIPIPFLDDTTQERIDRAISESNPDIDDNGEIWNDPDLHVTINSNNGPIIFHKHFT